MDQLQSIPSIDADPSLSSGVDPSLSIDRGLIRLNREKGWSIHSSFVLSLVLSRFELFILFHVKTLQQSLLLFSLVMGYLFMVVYLSIEVDQ